jgi:hypothetical protein
MTTSAQRGTLAAAAAAAAAPAMLDACTVAVLPWTLVAVASTDDRTNRAVARGRAPMQVMVHL